MNRLGGRGASSRMRVRFTRAWRGYKAGDEIAPPAALREQLLNTKTPLGDPVAELVDVPASAGEIQAQASEAAPESSQATDESQGLLAGLVGSKGKKKSKKE